MRVIEKVVASWTLEEVTGVTVKLVMEPDVKSLNKREDVYVAML